MEGKELLLKRLLDHLEGAVHSKHFCMHEIFQNSIHLNWYIKLVVGSGAVNDLKSTKLPQEEQKNANGDDPSLGGNLNVRTGWPTLLLRH